MKIRFLVAGIILVAVGIAGYAAYVSFFTGSMVRKVVIYSPFPIRYDTQEISGKKLFFIDEQALRAHILRKNPTVKTVVIEKDYPDSLQLTVVVRKPIAEIVPSSSPRYLDEEGVVLSQMASSPGLPIIEASGIPIYGNMRADWRLMKAVMYIQLFHKEQIQMERIRMQESGSYYEMTDPDGLEVYVPYVENPGSLVASLQVILSRFRIEGKRLSAVDFRFDKPVVTFQTGEKISPI